MPFLRTFLRVRAINLFHLNALNFALQNYPIPNNEVALFEKVFIVIEKLCIPVIPSKVVLMCKNVNG
jgi:hypothetical protein